MNVLPDLYINAESEQNVSIVSQDMLVNVPQDTKETEDMVVSRVKSKQGATQISIVPTTPNVVQIVLVDAEKASSPTEPCALTWTNALGNPAFAAPQQPVPTPREATSAAVRPP